MQDDDFSTAGVGKRIALTRIALGLTRPMLQRLTGISKQALSNYEHGKRRPTIEQARDIMRVTGVDLNWIYAGRRSGLPHNIAAAIAEIEQRGGPSPDDEPDPPRDWPPRPRPVEH